jgi:hypothetical protein
VLALVCRGPVDRPGPAGVHPGHHVRWRGRALLRRRIAAAHRRAAVVRPAPVVAACIGRPPDRTPPPRRGAPAAGGRARAPRPDGRVVVPSAALRHPARAGAPRAAVADDARPPDPSATGARARPDAPGRRRRVAAEGQRPAHDLPRPPAPARADEARRAPHAPAPLRLLRRLDPGGEGPRRRDGSGDHGGAGGAARARHLSGRHHPRPLPPARRPPGPGRRGAAPRPRAVVARLARGLRPGRLAWLAPRPPRTTAAPGARSRATPRSTSGTARAGRRRPRRWRWRCG